jgi:hypothetical protein
MHCIELSFGLKPKTVVRVGVPVKLTTSPV